MLDPYPLVIILSALAFSALFSGIETAFLSADKLLIKLEGEKSPLKGKVFIAFLKKPARFLGTTLIGNTIALVVYGAYMTEACTPFIQAYLPPFINQAFGLLILQTLLNTLILLIFAEFIPKSIFLLNPNHLLSFFALPIALIAYLLYPLVIMTTALAKFLIVRVLKQKYIETAPVFGLTDLHFFIKNTLMDDATHVGMRAKMVNNVIDLKKQKVRDCMVPRTEIVAVSLHDEIHTLREAFIETEHAKILVYRNDIDEIIGYCHSKELFKKPKKIETILTPIIVVPETNLASQLMLQFIKERKSLALVVDEFGGTAGIVSMEDIIEEILGEIQDEHDIADLIEKRIAPNNYLLSARHEITYLNAKYGWHMPTGDYDTLGGFILSVTERIPQVNETVHIAPFTFSIVSIKDTHIDKVKISVRQRHDQ